MSSLSIYLLTFALLLQTIYGESLSPLKHFCSSSDNFTTNDSYEPNLRQLWGNLYFQTPPEGFGFGSVGQDPYIAYGLALCRGDLEAADCRTCLNEATAEIRKRCPYNKGAIIWYDHCLFKYNNTDFLGKIDDQNKFYMWDERNVSDPTIFNQKTRELLSLLAKDASATPKLYAAGELELEKSKKLYGMAQCTRDISASDCSKCLDDIIGELPLCCDGKEGGRVVGGSCNIRYEIDPFVTA
ncbi:cysteine-rich repeat secretory protein 38-like [Corylus avellana]|uniref:cysteine-rich repeat secretory protein 38-like n=1 Tax=Corylus avellana TaxID=13451 RepID=UPI001E208330|nr:cysteine-rich repeat secretory protein 38-like [Corylus avellana]XP_059440670.1 cysteine-rich repeat secretory protein 38-like [Corylus avellana]